MSGIPRIKEELDKVLRVKNPSEERENFLRLDKNENLIPFPDDFVQMLRDEITADFVAIYPELDRLYSKIAKWTGLKESNIFITAGSDAAIKAVFEVFVGKDDGVALINPTYAMYYVYTNIFGGKLIEIDFPPDLELGAVKVIEVIKQHRPRLLCIANPNAPTGTVFSHQELKEIVKAAAENEVVVIIDEAYYLYYDKTLINDVDQYKNMIITRTFSKGLGLASARIGFAAANEEMIAALHKVRPMYEANAFGARFVEKLLDYPEIIKRNVDLALEGKSYLENRLAKKNMKYSKGHANFILIDVGSPEKSAEIVRSMKERNILIGGGFKHPSIKKYIRVTVGSKEQMKKFADELDEILAKA